MKAREIPKLTLENISKFWEREYSLFTMSSWKVSLDIINSRQWFKDSFTIFICIYHNGIATHFRSYEEENCFEKLVGEKIINNRTFRKRIIEQHVLYAEHLLTLYRQIGGKNELTPNFIRDFNISFGKLCAFNTFIQRGIDYIARVKKHKRIANFLIKRRTKYEHVLGAYDEYFEKICAKIAKKRKIKSPDLLKLLLINEFIDFIKINKLPKNLESRKRMSALILLPTPFLLVGKSASILFKKLKNQENKLNRQIIEERILKGTPIYKKRVKGYVQVISNLKQLIKFKNGYILVAPTTLPKYNPILKKAKAIITDEGGFLSHAAVFSREFRIPGVVGTKIATKVLKDGDLVEVDANRGIVKILENNQKPIYKKVFTRDFSLPMLDVWYKGEAYDSKPWSGKKQAFLPYIVFVREDGTVKSYYDPRGVKWIKNHIKETIKKDKKFLEKLEKKVEEKLKPIQPIYDGEKTLSKKDLLKFIKNFEIAYPWIEAMWWLCEMDENELRGLDISPIKKLRKKTTKLSTGTDIVVRKSLIKMFPKLKNYVHVLKIDEIKSEKIPKIPDLKKRDEGFIYTKNMMYIGNNRNVVEKKYNIKLETENIESKDEIKGIIVYKGIVKGKVKRVMGHKHIDLIKKGEILVSPMTTPDFLPAMKKASAFITDEGGLTCHAAIIAREMKKPCIVGTKIASQILKDGDLVEVDANRGIVKILKRK